MMKKTVTVSIEQKGDLREYSISPHSPSTRIIECGHITFGTEKVRTVHYAVSEIDSCQQGIRYRVGARGLRFVRNFVKHVTLENRERLVILDAWTFIVGPIRSDGDQEIDHGVQRTLRDTFHVAIELEVPEVASSVALR